MEYFAKLFELTVPEIIFLTECTLHMNKRSVSFIGFQVLQVPQNIH